MGKLSKKEELYSFDDKDTLVFVDDCNLGSS